MNLTFTNTLDHLTPEQLGQVHGEAFAEMAVEMRCRGVPVETWSEFMRHRLASLSKQFMRQEDVDAWAEALNSAYGASFEDEAKFQALMMQAAQRIQASRPN